MSIDNSEDILDSRDVIARIEELTAEWAESTGDDPSDYALSSDDLKVGLSEDDAEELAALKALAEEGEQYAPDWKCGEALIHADYFTEYAKQLADDLGMVPDDAKWPANHIDWDAAAEELKVDYTEIDFDGQPYFIR